MVWGSCIMEESQHVAVTVWGGCSMVKLQSGGGFEELRCREFLCGEFAVRGSCRLGSHGVGKWWLGGVVVRRICGVGELRGEGVAVFRNRGWCCSVG